ncbi:MAG: DNA polymerase III subunit alpha [Bacteroidales bacterium]|nr:DNA polymerase III subunit alpha [Bacteroidales bacterium]
MINFTHLHVHTQYSILDGASDIKKLIKKAKQDNMRAIAITDHGNMFGVKNFFDEAKKQEIKPIIGCEVYVANRTRFDKTESADKKSNHLIILAKNLKGYHNLIKLASKAYTEGFYYKPRIDKDLLFKHHEGLIISTACLAGEIPRAILNGDIEKAEKLILEYKNVFQDDFYLEMMRHKTDDPVKNADVFDKQEIVNNAFIKLSKKTGVKVIATNDCHFINAEDAEAHDRLICLNTGKDLDDPTRMRYTKQEFFKTQEEMNELFSDIPEAINNTNEIVDKVEEYDIKHSHILPEFNIPKDFENAYDYLRYQTYDGAKKRYIEIDEKIKQRIDFELSTIKKMGFPGYFLIVQDFINAAKNMGVSVGPGRGSAAGSVVAYCLGITDVDPIKYDLLFERFLNPDRISMPDIDIDFDEDGRDKVLHWVVDKYGKNRVAQIITFGTMATKMAIRDVARVEKLPLSEANRLAKLVPDSVKINTFKKAYEASPDLLKEKNSKNKLIRETLKYAEALEGSVRHTGIHACGVIIGKDDLTEHIPICTSKETDLLVTQYPGKKVEDVGMLKMDFLGLKTLSIIKDAVENVKISKGIDIDIENIPFDDKKTFELYSNGDTKGVFQFESDGMRNYLKELKPNKIEDLIAMNALYRPGPMGYIPSYIKRKYGKEKVEYDHPIMEDTLKSTFGITIYQEQVMQLSRIMAGFTRGEADTLRKIIGKKLKDKLPPVEKKFYNGCKKNGIEEKIYKKVWKDWIAFAEYAFNKSHSTCYAFVSYRMAYLKAHYPAEFMAAVLSRNLKDIKKISSFIDECQKQNIPVLGPDINESYINFTVNKKGEIRFGLAAIKGVGNTAVKEIINERNKNGYFKDIFDLTKRVVLRTVNKRALEALAYAGAFDNFGPHRAQYFALDNKNETFLEKVVKYSNNYQNQLNSQQQSLFGETESIEAEKLSFPDCEPWSELEKLKKEKEVSGFYISGHPLDSYKDEIKYLCNSSITNLNDNLEKYLNKYLSFACIVTKVSHKYTKRGDQYASFTIEDLKDSTQLAVFSEDYLKFKHFLVEGMLLLIKVQIRNKYYNSDQFSIKIVEMNLLSEAINNKIKNINLFIQLSDINDDIIEKTKKIFADNPGNCNINFNVYDNIDNLSAELNNSKFKVNCINVIKEIKKIKSLKYNLK